MNTTEAGIYFQCVNGPECLYRTTVFFHPKIDYMDNITSCVEDRIVGDPWNVFSRKTLAFLVFVNAMFKKMTK